MEFLKAKGAEKGPALLLGAYLAFSALWILLTDLLFDHFQVHASQWHTLKGIVYLAISGAILYGIANKFLRDARRLETTLAQVIQQTEFGVWFADEDGCILECNQASAAVLGYTPEELKGRKYLDFVHPDERVEAWRKLRSKAVGGDQSREGWCRKFIRKDGTTAWGRMTSSRITSDEASRVFLVGLLHDVTTEVRAMEALRARETELETAVASARESESKFHKLVDSALIGVVVGSTDGRFVEANDVFLRLLGYSRDELERGMLTHERLVPPEYRDRVRSAMEELNATNRFAPHESELLSKHGRRIPVLVGGGLLSRNADGSHQAAISVIDLRDARTREAQLSRLVQAVESAYESIIITELDGSISYVNAAFEKLTGYSRSEVIGKNPRFLKSGKTPAEEYRSLWQNVKDGRVWRGQFHNRRKDGTEYLEEATISPVRDTLGRTVNYLAVKFDVTRERELEQQLLQSQKMQTVGQLAGGIAHDLNNVLQVVQSCSELAMRRSSTDEYSAKKLNDIIAISKRGASIIGQLLMFSRQKGDQQRQLQINEVISDTGRMLRRLLRENIALEFRLDPKLPAITGDPVKISQVLFNLTVNARDAMPCGGTITISTQVRGCSPEHSGPFVVLSVKDTGNGIPKEIRGKIFDPFFTTKEDGKGTGLGLSTVQQITKQSRGSIHVISEVGQGTTFDLYYPMTNTTGPQVEPAATIHALSPLPLTGTVMVCEDDETVRSAISENLQSLGYTVICCENAVQALDIAQHGCPEVLITDIVMPGRDGVSLAQEMRAKSPRLKVILMSGHTDEDVVQNVANCTDMLFLEKPFTAPEFIDALRRLEELDFAQARSSIPLK